MSAIDRLIDSLLRIVRSEFSNYSYTGIYEYSIQKVDGNFIDAEPTDTTLTLPSISKIKLRSSILGEEVKPTVGNLCLVMFVNKSPSRPIAISCDPPNEEIDVDATISTKLGKSSPSVQIAGGGQPAARMGDTILAAGVFVGTVTSGSVKTQIG